MEPTLEKEGRDHVEDVVDKGVTDGNYLSRADFFEAQIDTLAESRSPWLVIKENLKLCGVVLACQVNITHSPPFFLLLFIQLIVSSRQMA